MDTRQPEKKTYDVSTLSRLMKKDFIFVIVVFLVLLLIFTDISIYESFGSVRSRKLEAENLAVMCSSEIERNCFQTFQINGIISSLVLVNDVNEENFNYIAARVFPDFPAADCVQLAPDGIVKYVYPLEGNENVLGHNLFTDEKRSAEAINTRASGIMTIGGPYPLIQGGEGFIGRLPIFIDDNHSDFWGFVNVVVRINKILSTVDFSVLDGRDYKFSIYKINDETGEKTQIYGTDFHEMKNSVTHRIDMPNAHWVLAIAPKGFWVNIHLVIVLSTLSLLLIAAFTILTLLFLKLRQSNIRLAQLATLDQLTGLYTKQTAIFTLKKEIDYANRNGTQVAVCFIDMNNFKQINDKYGHTIGDAALAKVSKRLTESI
ncbi:MAG: diguanylate cyclase [Lachnospiraceae bacterium]|nr:diguanylate cyclase [Lachnospiraceae bacterium]